MKPLEVNIATLKARLSEYLQKVKQGAEIIVLDRKHPVAKISVVSEPGEDVIISAPADARPIGEFKFPPFKSRVPTKSTELLLEARRKR